MRLIDADALEQKIGTMGIPEIDILNHKINLEAVYSAIRYAPTVGEWISVKDRLPSIAECVLIFETKYGIQTIVKGYFDHDAWWIAGWGMASGIVTHWMPLPEPPKEVEQG